jgi:hypothetical protein
MDWTSAQGYGIDLSLQFCVGPQLSRILEAAYWAPTNDFADKIMACL